VSGKFKRPTHESDAMKIFLSDSVAPEILPLLQRHGDTLHNMLAGIKAWSVYVPEYATEVLVDVYDERGRRVERFRLPVVP
jgi:hypothetical protein